MRHKLVAALLAQQVIIVFLIWFFSDELRQATSKLRPLVGGHIVTTSLTTRNVSCYLGKRDQLTWPGSERIKLASYGSLCQTPDCIAAYEAKVFNNVASSSSSDNVRIPAIRHILWKSDRVSAYFARQLKTWRDIHPDWLYVLWQDSDLEKFVAKYYTGALGKFRSLPQHIMHIDMIRYMILHHFGGTYADLDYILVRPLDRFRKFPAVVTRETEAHAFSQFGQISWPAPLLGNPAFMMSSPGHPFFLFAILQLTCREEQHYYRFAGPMGLSQLLQIYARDFPIADYLDGLVIVPASRNFYAFEGNSLNGGASEYRAAMLEGLLKMCSELMGKKLANEQIATNLKAYCKNVTNLDPITDKSDSPYAIHDHNKPRSSYHPDGSVVFHENPVDIRSVLPELVTADTLF